MTSLLVNAVFIKVKQQSLKGTSCATSLFQTSDYSILCKNNSFILLCNTLFVKINLLSIFATFSTHFHEQI